LEPKAALIIRANNFVSKAGQEIVKLSQTQSNVAIRAEVIIEAAANDHCETIIIGRRLIESCGLVQIPDGVGVRSAKQEVAERLPIRFAPLEFQSASVSEEVTAYSHLARGGATCTGIVLGCAAVTLEVRFKPKPVVNEKHVRPTATIQIKGFHDSFVCVAAYVAVIDTHLRPTWPLRKSRSAKEKRETQQGDVSESHQFAPFQADFILEGESRLSQIPETGRTNRVTVLDVS
jgi:hypothetical protein